MPINPANSDHHGCGNYVILVWCPTVVGERFVHFGRNPTTGAGAIRDYVTGWQLSNHNSHLSIQQKVAGRPRGSFGALAAGRWRPWAHGGRTALVSSRRTCSSSEWWQATRSARTTYPARNRVRAVGRWATTIEPVVHPSEWSPLGTFAGTSDREARGSGWGGAHPTSPTFRIREPKKLTVALKLPALTNFPFFRRSLTMPGKSAKITITERQRDILQSRGTGFGLCICRSTARG